MTARIAAALPPYAASVQGAFDRTMPPGVAPLILFATLARDERLFERSSASAVAACSTLGI
jgi:hypothetical protein